MDHITEPSSKKKKSKKDKKRKRSDAASPNITGSDNAINGSSKKKNRRNKKLKASNGASVEQGVVVTQESANESLSIQPSASSAVAAAAAATTTTTSPGQLLIFSSIVAPSTTATKSNKSPYQIKTIQGSVALLPSSLLDVPKCIQSLLHSLLLMYDAKMGGVLLSLEDNVKVLPIDNKSSSAAGFGSNVGLIGGRIVDDLPYIHYHFQAKGLLFCPKIGMKLKGQVVECTSTYITLTTHHILSTKIWTEKLHEQGFFYNEMSMEWTRERETTTNTILTREGDDADILGPSTSIYLDDIVEFVVERLLECGGYITLSGTHPSVSTLG
jgi:hypothetical protein